MTTPPDRPVVVGVDGSLASYTAVGWGVAEAWRRGTALRLVHVVERAAGADDPYRPTVGCGPAGAADEIADNAAAYALGCLTDLDVSAATRSGRVDDCLVDESRRAAVVVLGSRPCGALRRLFNGSPGARVAAHARCPLVVVRPRREPVGDLVDPRHGVGRVVVGVDGGDPSRAALRFAFEEAALRGVGLTAVHTWYYPLATSSGDLIIAGFERLDPRLDGNEVLDEALTPLRERYPRVPVRPLSVPAVSPAAALLHESGGAELLVVGSRGRSGFAALLLGSVSQAAIHHAACPVAVIHH
ncbi:universal stress protein [Planosporangium sp. 12N6]|uniref:universal stress protein n=1 Tax=Planosporangium spinosum TaxID=3402278 RepID=UPI003CE97ED8